MTYLIGSRLLTNGQHRLFEPIWDAITTIDSFGVAASALRLGRVDPPVGNFVRIESAQFAVDFCFPAIAPAIAMANAQLPTSFEVQFLTKAALPIYQINTPGYRGAVTNILSDIFVAFFERHRPWIDVTFGGDPYQWPPIFNFARALRNFITHHDGYVHFVNANAAPVTWHHLSYGPAQDGDPVIAGQAVTNALSVGDIFILLFETSDALDSHNCPFNP